MPIIAQTFDAPAKAASFTINIGVDVVLVVSMVNGLVTLPQRSQLSLTKEDFILSITQISSWIDQVEQNIPIIPTSGKDFYYSLTHDEVPTLTVDAVVKA